MNESDHGVIYMAFGTTMNIENVNEKIEIMLSVFKGVTQRVLLKSDDFTGQVPPNVRIQTWFPQQDILGKNIIFIVLKKIFFFYNLLYVLIYYIFSS